MEKFEVHILGCGSALPTLRHNPSAQVINLREKLFMIDCGEGTQLSMRRNHLKFSKLSHIFLSHLHGDHVLGLVPLISTLSLLGRTQPLHIYAHAPFEKLMKPWIDFFCHSVPFSVEFHTLPKDNASHLIFEDRSMEVHTIPLSHRMASCGFLFREKAPLPHIRRDMIDFLHIPVYEINRIKQGEGWTTEEGEFYPHERLTYPAERGRSYAYCSDTSFCPLNAPLLSGVDVLYHEATFSKADGPRAAQTCHSTAEQAATLAKNAAVGRLVIGHYSSRYEDETLLLNEASEVFPHTELASEGMVIQL